MAFTVHYSFLRGIVGSYTGTATTNFLDMGFVPQYVEAYDVTSGMAVWRWFRTFDKSVSSIEGVVVASPTVTGAASIVATIADGGGGATVLLGTSSDGIGLQLGTNTVINASAHAYQVFAYH